MRRWVAFIVLVLALGMSATVLVAWVSAGVDEVWYRGAAVPPWANVRNDEMALTTTGWQRLTFDYGLASSAVYLTPLPEHLILGGTIAEPFWSPRSAPSWEAARTRCASDHSIRQRTHGLPMRAMLSTELWLQRYGINRNYLGRCCGFPALPLESTSFRQGLPIAGIAFGLHTPSYFGAGGRKIIEIGPFALVEQSVGFLPLRPILPGFLIDALLFALAWSMLVLALPAWRTWRRNRRRRRSQCPWCGHGSGPSPRARCAECGQEPDAVPRLLSRAVAWTTAAAVVTLIAANASMALFLHWQYRTIDEPMREAIAHAPLDEVMTLIDAARVKADSDPQGCGQCVNDAALNAAAMHGRLDVVRRLLEDGADPYRVKEPQTCDPLRIAIWRGHREIVELLFASVDPDLTAPDAAEQLGKARSVRNSALTCAVVFEDIELIRALLAGRTVNGEANARPDATPSDDDLIPELLSEAAAAHDPRVLEVILNDLRIRAESAKPDGQVSLSDFIERSTSLEEAVRLGHLPQVEMLLAAGARVREGELESPLIASILGGDPRMVERILDAGAAPESESCPSVLLAIATDQPDIARLLVARGANPESVDAEHGPMLCAVLALGLPVESVEIAFEIGAGKSFADGTLEIGDCIPWETVDERVLARLRRERPIFSQAFRGGVPLVTAMERGEVHAIRRLLLEGADPHEKLDWSESPVRVAVELLDGTRAGDQSADPNEVRRAAKLVEAAAQPTAR